MAPRAKKNAGCTEESKLKQQATPGDKILMAFHRLNPDYKIHPSVMNEILYMATSPNAERVLHKRPSFPGMPRPKHPNSWKECHLDTSEYEIEEVRALAKRLEECYASMHYTTIGAFVLGDWNPQEIEEMVNTILVATDGAAKILNKLKDQNPDWKLWRPGRPKKEIPFHITKILAEEFYRAKNEWPTISNRQIQINANQTASKAWLS